MKNLLPFLVLFMVLITGCDQNKRVVTKYKSQVDASKTGQTKVASTTTVDKLLKEGNKGGASEELARIGEILLQTEGFVYADSMFNAALKVDLNNSKALFYSAITAPLMTFKGLASRFENVKKGFSSKYLDKSKLEHLKASAKKLGHAEYINFLDSVTGNKKAFVSDKEIQGFLKEVVLKEFKKSVAKLDRLIGSELKLNLKNSNKGSKERCVDYTYRESGTTTNNYSYNYYHCYQTQSDTSAYGLISEAVKVEADDTDIALVRDIFQGVVSSLVISTAYSIENLSAAFERVVNLKKHYRKKGWGSVRSEDVVGILSDYPNLFSLNSDDGLVDLKKNIITVLENNIKLKEIDRSLCEGETREKNIFKSLCLSIETVNSFSEMKDYLSGPVMMSIGKDASQRNILVKFDLTQLLDNPINDLKEFLPSSFDAYGEPEKFDDPTFNGIIPDGDLVEKLKKLY
jgi:hypothetical protein